MTNRAVVVVEVTLIIFFYFNICEIEEYRILTGKLQILNCKVFIKCILVFEFIYLDVAFKSVLCHTYLMEAVLYFLSLSAATI